MLFSTVRPRNRRDCWYVRARPSRARSRDGRVVTSSPNNSTCPAEGARSPAITLKSVVLPAPFGPRIARLSPGSTSSVTSRTAWRPPNRRPTPRRRSVGPACSAGAGSVKRLLDDLVRDHAVLDDADLALPRQLRLHTLRLRAAGRWARALEEPVERLVDVRHEADDVRSHGPVLALDELERVLILDALAVAVEMEHAAVRHLECGLEGPRHRRLELRAECTAVLVECLNERPRGVVVLLHDRPVRVRRLGLQARRSAEAAHVGACDLRSDLLVCTEKREEQVPVELLRVQLAERLLERLQRRRRSRAADDPEVAVHLVRRRQLPDE